MHQQPYQLPGSGGAINQISGNLPIYRPRREGPLIARVLPAFVDGVEQPYANWDIGKPGTSDGLGEQHTEPDVVTIWKGKPNYLSAVSRDPDSGEYGKSPASFACDRLTPLFEEAEKAAAAGHEIDKEFHLDKYNNPWIREGGMHLVQAVLMVVDGKPKTDPSTGRQPLAVIHIPWSAVKDLRGSLFSPSEQWTTGERAASATDNKLGDYASCAGARALVIYPDPASETNYKVALSTPVPMDPQVAAGLWTPWDELAPKPTHAESIEALRSLLRPDIFAYALTGTPFERMVDSDTLRLGAGLRVVVSTPSYTGSRSAGFQTGGQGWEPPQGGGGANWTPPVQPPPGGQQAGQSPPAWTPPQQQTQPQQPEGRSQPDFGNWPMPQQPQGPAAQSPQQWQGQTQAPPPPPPPQQQQQGQGQAPPWSPPQQQQQSQEQAPPWSPPQQQQSQEQAPPWSPPQQQQQSQEQAQQWTPPQQPQQGQGQAPPWSPPGSPAGTGGPTAGMEPLPHMPPGAGGATQPQGGGDGGGGFWTPPQNGKPPISPMSPGQPGAQAAPGGAPPQPGREDVESRAAGAGNAPTSLTLNI